MPRKPTVQHEIKRGQIVEWPRNTSAPQEVAARVTYTGSTLHKTHPSPAVPPAYRRRNHKSKCDRYAEEDWPRILRALQEAIGAMCVSHFQSEFPSRAWIWINDVLHEARLTNEKTGDYHGFPIDDPRDYPQPLERVEAAPRVYIPTV